MNYELAMLPLSFNELCCYPLFSINIPANVDWMQINQSTSHLHPICIRANRRVSGGYTDFSSKNVDLRHLKKNKVFIVLNGISLQRHSLPFCKQGFFVSQTRLLCFSINASLFPKQDFFAMHPSLFALRQNLYGAHQRVMCVFFLHIHNSLAK